MASSPLAPARFPAPLAGRARRAPADVSAYELPVLSCAYAPARRFIDGGRARGVGSDAARARTITVYTNVAKAVLAAALEPGTDSAER